jgi:TonB family protein
MLYYLLSLTVTSSPSIRKNRKEIALKLIIRCCLLLLLSIIISALASAQESSVWQRYGSYNEEFSALLPDAPSANGILRPVKENEEPKRGRMYASYSDGVVYVIISLDNPNRKDALDVFISEFPQYRAFNAGFKFEREVTLNGFKGRQYSVTANTVNGTVLFYMTNERVYIFEVVSEDLSKPSVNKFLKSLTLDGKAKGKDLTGISQGSDAAAAATSSVPSPSTTTQGTVEGSIYKPSETTRKAVLVTSPEPQYTEEARKNQIAGTVVLRAVFASTGKVTNIRTVSGLEHGLTGRAREAATKIKFIPAIKDGQFVSQYIQIEYNFNLY